MSPSRRSGSNRGGRSSGAREDTAEPLEDLIARLVVQEVEKRLTNFMKTHVTTVIVHNHSGAASTEIVMRGDIYKGNTGFTGPRAGDRATNVSFDQMQQQAFTDIELSTLISELATLRSAMTREAAANPDADPDIVIAVAEIAQAEKAAKKGPRRSFDI